MKQLNLTYKELLEIVKDSKEVFEIRVESNLWGAGRSVTLKAFIDSVGHLNTCLPSRQHNINGIDYGWSCSWQDVYEGRFDFLGYLVNENVVIQKPEVLKVGTKVLITEEARKCGGYYAWSDKAQSKVGTVHTIEDVFDDQMGVYYEINNCAYPYYCVAPVVEEDTIILFGKPYLKSDVENAINNLKEIK